MIREHLDTYDPGELPRDFIDVYNKQIEADCLNLHDFLPSGTRLMIPACKV